MKEKKWILLSCLYLLLILMDGLLTYINTPDLSLEGNPLVSKLGFGWTALFLANAIGFFLYVFTVRYFCHYQTKIIPAKGCFEYYLLLYYDCSDKPWYALYKFPKNWSPLIACVGYCFAYSFLIARLILVVDWLFFTFDLDLLAWDFLYRLSPFGRLDLWIALILCIALFFLWHRKEYKNSALLSQATNSAL